MLTNHLDRRLIINQSTHRRQQKFVKSLLILLLIVGVVNNAMVRSEIVDLKYTVRVRWTRWFCIGHTCNNEKSCKTSTMQYQPSVGKHKIFYSMSMHSFSVNGFWLKLHIKEKTILNKGHSSSGVMVSCQGYTWVFTNFSLFLKFVILIMAFKWPKRIHFHWKFLQIFYDERF